MGYYDDRTVIMGSITSRNYPKTAVEIDMKFLLDILDLQRLNLISHTCKKRGKRVNIKIYWAYS